MLLRLSFYLISTSILLLDVAAANEPSLGCGNAVNQPPCATSSNASKSVKIAGPAPNFKKGTSWWFSDTYNAAQEQVFERLRNEFQQDPWGICTLKTGAIPAFAFDKRQREVSPMDVLSNHSEIFDSELVSFTGNIDLQRADQHVMANQLDYNQNSGVLDLYGDILYSDTGVAIHGDSARINLQEDSSLLRDVSFIIPASPVRGSAKAVYRDSATFSRYNDATYTACEPGNQDWMVHASKMKVNDETGRVAIKNAWLEFKNMPVMYIPYGSFPVDNRRLTGLLTPTIGLSNRSGVDISMPFYWNVAPNYDLTLTPRYMSKRGFMMGTDFRYMWEGSEGQISVEMMPEDKLTDEMRWGGSLQHETKIMDNLNVDVNANYVSDKSYFSDLDGTLGMSNRNRYLGSDANLNYELSWMAFNARVENYQNIDPNSSDRDVPYRRLPQLTLDMFQAFEQLPYDIPLELALNSEFVYFQRHFADGEPEGSRFNIEPAISFPFVNQSGFVIPKVAVQHTSYWLTENDGSRSNYLNKTLPIVSLDSGLFFERDFASNFGALTHTIEPRLFYLYVPYVNQDDLPDFDTSEYDFNMGQLFRSNEFNGVDKT
ncbi:MAG: LPS assembly protein LptD, partial [Methyloprofundus sp.]|nr:LPS assembly protein LptD [Methyloprofundus sp.]